MTADERVRLLAIAQAIVDRSTAPEARGFDTQAWLEHWLYFPQGALGGCTPSEILCTPGGYETVAKLLGALDAGTPHLG